MKHPQRSGSIEHDEHEDCGCATSPRFPDAASFLQRLAPSLVERLARTVGIDERVAHANRADVVNRVLAHHAKNPEAPLVLRKEGKFPIERLEKGQRVAILGVEQRLWRLRDAGDRGFDFEFEDDLVFPVDVDFSARCGLYPFLTTIVVPNAFAIPDDAALVTDAPSLQFEQGVTMGLRAAIWGTSDCGLRVRTPTLTGPGVGQPMSEWALISTSIEADLDELLVAQVQGIGGLFELRGRVPPYSGARGADGPGTALENVRRGRNGSDATCGMFFVNPAGNGESFAGITGTEGVPGGEGGDGYSPRVLRVTVTSSLAEGVRFWTAGAKGGNGGRGGVGQSLFAGDGGNVPAICSLVTPPGAGGDAGTPGRGGRGGAGGRGGNGGTIRLRIPDSTLPTHYRACTRGGEGGRGGAGGVGGIARAGATGAVLDIFTGAPPRFRDRSSTRGNAGPNGADASRGWNGPIVVNGARVVERNDLEGPEGFRFPVGTQVVGVAHDCWD